MNILETKSGRVCLLGLQGRLDATNAVDAQERLLASIKRSEAQVVLDLSELSYLSSAGLRVLLVAAKEVKARGGEVVACAASDYVKEILEIAGFTTFIPVVETRELAIQTLA